MAWIDEVHELENWLKGGGGAKDRSIGARLFVLSSAGNGFYAEGSLDLTNGKISGLVKRYETKDRWDFIKQTPLNIFDDLPFDPTKLEDVPLSIDLNNGAITVGSVVFPQPAPVWGRFLVSAQSIAFWLLGPQLLALNLVEVEFDIPK